MYTMYIEFPLPIDHRIRQRAIPRLHEEIRVWARTHHIDYSNATVSYSSERNTERVYLHSDRAIQLFCISWNPRNSDYKQYTLRNDV